MTERVTKVEFGGQQVEVPAGGYYDRYRMNPDLDEVAHDPAAGGIIKNWWRQGKMGSAKAHYEGIKAFSETDQTEDLKAITVPTLVLAGDDDQVVPYKTGALMQDKLLRNSELIIYPGFSHGMLTVNADVVNADILKFIRG